MKISQNRALVSGLAALILMAFAVELTAQDRRRGRRKRDRKSDSNALKTGQEAPDFELNSLDGKSKTKLSEICKEKPVVLFFGSYT